MAEEISLCSFGSKKKVAHMSDQESSSVDSDTSSDKMVILDDPVVGNSSPMVDHVTRKKLFLDSSVVKAIEENDEDTVETVLEWLTNNPQCVNAVDSDGRTALHLAVECLNVQLTKILLEAGADPSQTGQAEQTTLHILCDLGKGKESDTFNEIGDMLLDNITDVNTIDSDECTALHYAARNHHNKLAIRLLEEKGADMTLGDCIGDTAVHMAAESGNHELLSKMIEKDKECVHLKGYNEETLLHQAVQNGHIETVKVILNSPSQPIDVNARSKADETPLHALAVDGSLEIGKLLLGQGAKVNPPAATKYTKTPFHKAAFYGQSDLAIYLLKKGAKVTAWAFQDILGEHYVDIAKAVISSDQWPIALRGLYKRHGKQTTAFRELVVKMPEVAKLVLDHCTVMGDISVVDDRDFHVLYNYEFIEDYSKEKGSAPKFDVPDPGDDSGKKMTYGCGYTEIKQHDFCPKWGPTKFTKADHPLQLMAKTDALDLLDHPVVASLLHYKWLKFGLCGYIINLLTYIIYLSFLTAFALLVPNPQSPGCYSCVTGMNISVTNLCPESNTSGAVDPSISEMNISVTKTCDCIEPSDSLRIFVFLSSSITLLLALSRVLFEFIKLLTQRLSYLKAWVNWLKNAQYLCSILFVFVYTNKCLCVLDWQWQVGVVAVFLGWINLILFVSKLPIIGIYVIIMIKICYTFTRLLALTVLLVITFGIVLFMVFFDKAVSRSPFSDVPRSFLKVMTMITGELEYNAIFRLDPAGERDGLCEIRYPPISYILWIIFLILIPIVFSNMLVSLAVSDTNDVQKHARLRKLALQVDQVLSMEELLVLVEKYFPKSWRFRKAYRKVYPNKKRTRWYRTTFLLWEGTRYDYKNVILTVIRPPKSMSTEESNTVANEIHCIKQRMDQFQLLLEEIARKNGIEIIEATVSKPQ